MLVRSLVQKALGTPVSHASFPKWAMNWWSFTLPFSRNTVPEVVSKAPEFVTKPRGKSLMQRYYSTNRPEAPKDDFKTSGSGSHFTFKSTQSSSADRSYRRSIVMYSVAALVAVGGLSYAAVPLYKMFCAATGYAGTTKVADSNVKSKIVYDHPIRIRFTSQVSDTLPWSFMPVQREMTLCPGEKALAFYVATNHHPTDALIGVATYNVVPDLAGAYFNKIQCFCFDEQRLNPGETVNMPIHFFVDPAIEDDKVLRGINEITLSYTFFLADDQSAEWWEEERDKHARPTSA